MKIKEIIQEIERLAPLPLQESYDNSGLQVGDIHQPVKGILVCLDVTEEVVDEAIDKGCNLIVSHHPLLFKPMRSLTGRTYIERCLIKACKFDLVIYASHTNLDNAPGGVNYKLAELMGLQNIRILSPKKDALLKLVTFVPVQQAETVRNVLFQSGAGHAGEYDSCSFNTHGTGTFRGSLHTNPFAGQPGIFHTEKEVRIETILPSYKKAAVTRALLSVHPYEEPVFDFYALQNSWEGAGSGVVGELPASEEETEFLQRIKHLFKISSLKHSVVSGKQIREVAICGGSGAFLISEAIAYGADVFITGEAKYNDFYDVEDKILLAVIGHYESEVCTKEIFYTLLSKKFPTFAVHFSNVNSNPVNYL